MYYTDIRVVTIFSSISHKESEYVSIFHKILNYSFKDLRVCPYCVFMAATHYNAELVGFEYFGVNDYDKRPK